jgi:hypothetical protein
MDKRRFQRVRLPAVTRDAGAEQRAERVARGGQPAPGARAATTPAPSSVGLGPGEALPRRERRYFERRLGAELGAVRIHPGAAAAEAWEARAFTAGRDVGFAPGLYRPGTPEGRRLMGHELAHVLEQGATARPAIQLDGPPRPGQPELKLPDTEAAGRAEAVGGGLSTLTDVATEDPVIKARVIEPLKSYALSRWDRLGTDAKAGLVAGGVATYGTALAGMLGSPEGRSVLSDFNLAAPLSLVPYGTIADFRFILPETGSGPVVFAGRLEADDWLRLMLGVPEDRFAPQLGVDLTWRYDPASDGLSLSGGKLDMTLMPGLSLAAGAGVDLSWPTPIPSPHGAPPAWSMQSIPGPVGPAAPLGYGAFISVDLVQLPIIPAWLHFQLGGEPSGG